MEREPTQPGANGVRILALALLVGCAEARETPEPVPTEPVPRVVPTSRGAYVCFAPLMGESDQWPAMCAPLGEWQRCAETATHLQCAGVRERSA